MSSERRRFIRRTRSASEVVIHLDGHVQQGMAPPPSTPEAIEETSAAADLVASAQRRADELLASAAKEVMDVRAAAARLGQEEGYREGMAAARAELAEHMELVQTVGRSAKEARDQLLAGAESDVIELVLATVEAVLGELAQVDQTIVLRSLDRALQRLGGQNVLRIRVHPQDVSVIAAELDSRTGDEAEWEVREDGAVSIGGCVIDTASGEIDARLDVQLAEVARLLREAVPDAA